ncbi:hypothetical protein ACA910_020414 [Epithemia clementina (nom. ined.)]
MKDRETSPSTTTASPLVILEWDDVVASETTEQLLNALEHSLGPGGIGLVAIRNVPNVVQAKQECLPQAHMLANLPLDYLENHLTHKPSLYNAGWSHGKEKLGDKPDFAKGSFYFNPVTDKPGTEEDRKNFPLSYPTNIWPEDDKIPGFKDKAVRLGQILTGVVIEIAKHVDALAQTKVPNYPLQFLYNALKDTDKAKARLLYYFPLTQTNNDDEDAAEDSWIGWHADSGFLTALAGDMYVDHGTGQIIPNPDPDAGLYVLDRNNVCHRVNLPSDCVAVQIGECTQIVTGGVVGATPHCVRGPSVSSSVSRISLACFVDTAPSFPLLAPQGSSREEVLAESGLPNRRVPPLNARWTTDGMTFGDFLQKSFEIYYDWKKS